MIRPAAVRERSSAALGTAAAIFYIILWASAYVPSKLGATLSPPYWFLAVRFALAGGLMTLLAVVLRRPFPSRPAPWLAYALLGLLANGVYLGLTYTALSRGLASGVGAIVASTNPLILAAIAPWLLREKLTAVKAAGLLLGFGGVLAIVLARGHGGSAAPLDVALALAGVVGSVAATVLFKRVHGDGDLFAINAIGLLAAALLMLPLAIVFEGTFPAALTSDPVLLKSMAYVVLVMSAGASILWYWLLSRGEASRVSAFYFLTPAFGLGFGALLLGESFHLSDVFGLAAVAAGIILVQRSA